MTPEFSKTQGQGLRDGRVWVIKRPRRDGLQGGHHGILQAYQARTLARSLRPQAAARGMPDEEDRFLNNPLTDADLADLCYSLHFYFARQGRLL